MINETGEVVVLGFNVPDQGVSSNIKPVFGLFSALPIFRSNWYLCLQKLSRKVFYPCSHLATRTMGDIPKLTKIGCRC